MNFDRTPGSVLILGAILVMSALALWVAPAIKERNLLRPYWLLRRKQYDTIITSGFIHGDFGHLLFNSLTFYFFAPSLEHRIGTARFVALYFIGLILSSLGTVFAYIVYYPKQMLYLYFAVPIPASLFAFGYVAYSWWASKHKRDNINHDAHLDGAITGLIFVGLTDFPAWSRALHQVFG